MTKIALDPGLYQLAKKAAAVAGYSSVEEFVAHCIENELKRRFEDDAEKKVSNELRGLGYIE